MGSKRLCWTFQRQDKTKQQSTGLSLRQSQDCSMELTYRIYSMHGTLHRTDAMPINTCTFIAAANASALNKLSQQKSRSTLGQLSRSIHRLLGSNSLQTPPWCSMQCLHGSHFIAWGALQMRGSQHNVCTRLHNVVLRTHCLFKHHQLSCPWGLAVAHTKQVSGWAQTLFC
jgi:hypothetical protein